MHVYFVCERLNLGDANWNRLIAIFDGMGTDDSKFPALNLHKRTRLDGNAVIYESKFSPDEVSGAAFRQMLADEFGVPIEDVPLPETTQENYAGFGTPVWVYSYGAFPRFIIRRFGGAQYWHASNRECVEYLILNTALWGEETE